MVQDDLTLSWSYLRYVRSGLKGMGKNVSLERAFEDIFEQVLAACSRLFDRLLSKNAFQFRHKLFF